MKMTKIYTRDIMVRTGYKAHPYKQATEIFIAYGCKNTPIVYMPNVRVSWKLRVDTMKKDELVAFAKNMGISRPAMWMKSIVARYIQPNSKETKAECLRYDAREHVDEFPPRH